MGISFFPITVNKPDVVAFSYYVYLFECTPLCLFYNCNEVVVTRRARGYAVSSLLYVIYHFVCLLRCINVPSSKQPTQSTGEPKSKSLTQQLQFTMDRFNWLLSLTLHQLSWIGGVDNKTLSTGVNPRVYPRPRGGSDIAMNPIQEQRDILNTVSLRTFLHTYIMLWLLWPLCDIFTVAPGKVFVLRTIRG